MVALGHVVLAVDDDPAVAESHVSLLEAIGARPLSETDPVRVERRLAERPEIEMVLLDVRMQPLSGMDVLQRIKVVRPEVGVVMATVVHDIDLAVRAIKAGAYNYLLKPLQQERVEQILRSYFSNRPRAVHEDPRFAPFITACPLFTPIFQRVRSFAQADVTVLVQGETGTGKEIVARLVHTLSARAQGPFVALNMAGLSQPLFESELFGHKKGAFTGAMADHAGFFEAAAGGTLFLDEIGELSLDSQAKLLRVLQTRRFTWVGETAERESSARIVVATNRDLREEVRAGRFREDLFFRLTGHVVDLPPLRERPGDVEVLAGYFLRKYCSQYGRTIEGFAIEAMDLLKKYPYPGNVRELEGLVSAAVLIERSPSILAASLPGHIRCAEADPSDLDEVKRQAIHRALAECDGSPTRAAEKLGVHRATLFRWLKEERERKR